MNVSLSPNSQFTQTSQPKTMPTMLFITLLATTPGSWAVHSAKKPFCQWYLEPLPQMLEAHHLLWWNDGCCAGRSTPSSSPSSRVSFMHPSPWTHLFVKAGGVTWGDCWDAGSCSVVAAQSFAAPWSSQKCKDLLASHTQSDVDRHGLRDLFRAEVKPLLSSPTQPLPSRSLLSLFWLCALFAWLAQSVKPSFAQHSRTQHSSSLFLLFFKALPDGEKSH